MYYINFLYITRSSIHEIEEELCRPECGFCTDMISPAVEIRRCGEGLQKQCTYEYLGSNVPRLRHVLGKAATFVVRLPHLCLLSAFATLEVIQVTTMEGQGSVGANRHFPRVSKVMVCERYCLNMGCVGQAL